MVLMARNMGEISMSACLGFYLFVCVFCLRSVFCSIEWKLNAAGCDGNKSASKVWMNIDTLSATVAFRSNRH
ncbi:hypothetical protein V8C43DRAFT_283029 [Trichoderma afarasin]